MTTIFSIAASDENTQLMQTTANLGADINRREDGRSALTFAVESNRVKTVEKLLELGVDPNEPDEGGNPILQTAQAEEFQEVARLLKKYGAKEN